MEDGGLLGGIGAVALRDRVRCGELSCADVAAAFIEARGDDEIHAWAAVDPGLLVTQARELDGLGPGRRGELELLGVPVGIKDTFDTADLPTAYGSPIYAGHRAGSDAPTVRRLRAAGALIAGKTKCAEFGWMYPPDTDNPRWPGRTPGGSSNGSAAAVAARTVPLATGAQTGGSVNRPASYCGVIGFKPTFGLIPREGIKQLAPTLDTVGLFAREVDDLELIARVLAGSAWPRAASGGVSRIGFARTPVWKDVEGEAQDAIERAVGSLREDGVVIDELELPPGAGELIDAQKTIQFYETAVALAPERASAPEKLSDPLSAALEEGASIGAERYESAKRASATFAPSVIELLERYDGVLTPSASGVPPLGLHFTGDPLFSRLWTLIGSPCVSVPLAWTAEGLPVALQLVAAPGRDRDVLGAARYLLDRDG